MTDRAKKLLWDMRKAGEQIRNAVATHTASTFAEDLMVRSAVERWFEIMGEVSVRLRRDALEVFESRTTFRRLLELRNLLIHVYDRIDADKIWEYTQVDLPEFLPVLNALLDQQAT